MHLNKKMIALLLTASAAVSTATQADPADGANDGPRLPYISGMALAQIFAPIQSLPPLPDDISKLNASPLFLYGIDDQTPFLGAQDGGYTIPYRELLDTARAELTKQMVAAFAAPQYDEITLKDGISVGHKYWVKLNGIEYSYTPINGDTAIDILTHLQTAMEGLSAPFKITVIQKPKQAVLKIESLVPQGTFTDAADALLKLDSHLFCNGKKYPNYVCHIDQYGADILISDLWKLDLLSAPAPQITLNKDNTVTIDFKIVGALSVWAFVDLQSYGGNNLPAKVYVEAYAHVSIQNISLDGLKPEQILGADGKINKDHVFIEPGISDGKLELQGLSEMFAFYGALAGNLAGPFVSIVGAIAGGKTGANYLEYQMKSAFQNFLKESINKVTEQYTKLIDAQVKAHSAVIKKTKDTISSFEYYFNTVQKKLISGYGVTLSRNYALFNWDEWGVTPNHSSADYPGGWAPAKFPVQDATASSGIQFPVPKDTSASIFGRLLLPGHTCNYSVGGQGDASQWDYSWGSHGLDHVNGDVVNKACADYLKKDLQVYSYVSSVVGTFGNTNLGSNKKILPVWSKPLAAKITGGTFKKIVEGKREYYACDFEVSSLPKGAVVRLAIDPTGSKYDQLLERMHLDMYGSSTSKHVAGDYFSRELWNLSYEQRNYLFRTALITVGAVKALNGAYMVLDEFGNITTDAFGVPKNKFELGYKGVGDYAVECPSGSEHGNTIGDEKADQKSMYLDAGWSFWGSM
ncbi:hypothetical protein WDW37_19125 [Bdellovibrionota bacterium FG-1]